MHSVLSKEVTSDTKEAIQSMPSVKPSPLSNRARNKPTQSVPLSDITNLDSPIPSTQAQAGKKWARIQRLIIRSLTQHQESETPLLTLTPSLLQNAKLLNVSSLMNTYHQRWWLITSPAGRNELALLERAQTQEPAHRSRARNFNSSTRSHWPVFGQTWADKDGLRRLCGELNFNHLWIVTQANKSRCLSLFWNKSLHIEVLSFSSNHVDAIVGDRVEERWQFTRIYGLTDTAKKHETWSLLHQLH